MSVLARASVQRVQAALENADSTARVIELAETARSAEDAATSVACALGQIVKSLVFAIDGSPVMALVAAKLLPEVLGIPGKVGRGDADAVKAVTGFSIGGVLPLAHASPLPIAIDAGLQRYEMIYAAVGHPHCVFPESPAALVRMTGGILSDNLGEPADG